MQVRKLVPIVRAPARFRSVVLGLMLASPAYAADLSSDVRKGAAGPDTSDGGYFEIGVEVASSTSIIVGMPEGNKQGEIHTYAFLDVSFYAVTQPRQPTL